MYMKEEDPGAVASASSSGGGDVTNTDMYLGGVQSQDENAHIRENQCVDEHEDDFTSKLPSNLWSDDFEPPLSMANGSAGAGQQDYYKKNYSNHDTMNHEEKKQAALKTIAELQQWATMKNATAMGTGAKSLAGENNNTMEFSDPRRSHWNTAPQQRTFTQHEQQMQAATLQRIIQDHLTGKQLTLIEQQILQQYIRQQQEQRFQTQFVSNDASTASLYRMPIRHNTNHVRSHVPDQEQLARAYQERLSIAAAAANGSYQARINQAHAEALLALQRQQQQHQVVSRQNYYAPNADHRYVQPKQHVDSSMSWSGQGLQAPSLSTTANRCIPVHGPNYNVLPRSNHEGGTFRQQSSAGAHHIRPNGTQTLPREGVANPVQTLRDIGKTLFHLGITVEGAVNAGLLGGLSASDVRIVLESYRIETELKSASMTSHGMMQNASDAIPFASRVSHVNVPQSSRLGKSKSGSFGNLSAPTPSSPVWSAGATSTGSLPIHMGSILPKSPKSEEASVIGDDSSDGLLDQIIDPNQNIASAIKRQDSSDTAPSLERQSSERFDAAQYGFFGDVSKVDDTNGELGDELHRDDEGSNAGISESGLLRYLDDLKLGTDFS